MFIPRGKVLYENLATTYVLVDALAADLCEGGFSGVIEVVLRDTDAHILIADGMVVGVVEQRGLKGRTGELNRRDYSKATVPEVAARARYERGRVSVYSCSADTALAVAGLAGAEQLYAQLSTDFADLEKMISKLARERDRQWFIELTLGDGGAALLHLEENRCRIITSDLETGVHESEAATLVNNPALLTLLDACNQSGGTFDVYFRSADDHLAPMEATLSASPEALPAIISSPANSSSEVEAADHAQPVPEDVSNLRAAYGSLAAAQAFEGAVDGEVGAGDPVPASALELAEARLEALRRAAGVDREEEPLHAAEPTSEPVVPNEPTVETIPPQAEPSEPQAEPSEAAESDEARAIKLLATAAAGLPRHTSGLSAIRKELQAGVDFNELTEGQIMNEVKRLLGEIARTIEDAARAIEQRDTFSIYLRAGQLKVADRYPFLDPFGAEFEYLAGEIAFVGNAAPWEFIEGFTEALKLAVEGVAQASVQGTKIRAEVADALQRLLDRNRAEFVEYGLDGSVEQIIAE